MLPQCEIELNLKSKCPCGEGWSSACCKIVVCPRIVDSFKTQGETCRWTSLQLLHASSLSSRFVCEKKFKNWPGPFFSQLENTAARLSPDIACAVAVRRGGRIFPARGTTLTCGAPRRRAPTAEEPGEEAGRRWRDCAGRGRWWTSGWGRSGIGSSAYFESWKNWAWRQNQRRVTVKKETATVDQRRLSGAFRISDYFIYLR